MKDQHGKSNHQNEQGIHETEENHNGQAVHSENPAQNPDENPNENLNVENDGINGKQSGKQKGQKGCMSCLLRLCIFGAVFILSVALLTWLTIFLIGKYNEHKINQLAESFLIDETLSWQHELELFGDEKLEGDKLTFAEKVELGLNPFVLDTAKNGIPDWMEIEEYGTDPTKFSTAEDGISDLAKIEEGLDPLEPIDPSTIEPFTVEHKEDDLALYTNDLNAKYHTVIRPYRHQELEATYHPVREPVQVHHYEGEVALHYGEVDDPESLAAYYFDFDKREMVEIKEQDNLVDDQEMRVTINNKFPIFIIDDKMMNDIAEFYYFRVSGLTLSRMSAGFDHKVFIFEVGSKLDTEDFEDVVIEGDDGTITEFSYQEIDGLSAFTVEKIYTQLDKFLDHEYHPDESILSRGGIIDYGKMTGTREHVKQTIMPWLYEEKLAEEEDRTNHEDRADYEGLPDKAKDVVVEEVNEREATGYVDGGKRIVDSGFDIQRHAFRFTNLKTELSSGGVCAGFSRITERTFNQFPIEESLHYEPQKFLTKYLTLRNLEASYDLSEHMEHFSFLEDRQMFDYRFTDPALQHLNYPPEMKKYKMIYPDQISNPDQTMIDFIDTHWLYKNDVTKTATSKSYKELSVLDTVEEIIGNGQIVTVELNSPVSGGHMINAYKIAFDQHDPDRVDIYVYDNNLPYDRLQELGTEEVKIELHIKHNRGLFGNKSEFDFHFHPIDSNNEYVYSDLGEADDRIRFHFDDELIEE